MKNIKMTDRTMKLNLANTYVDDDVTVEIPDDYIKPENTIEITENGTIDVSQYASAEVSVPAPSLEGTAVPIGKPIDKIYFNTSLSTQETINYLKELTYIQTDLFSEPVYCPFIMSTSSDSLDLVFILISKSEEENNYIITLNSINLSGEYSIADKIFGATYDKGWYQERIAGVDGSVNALNAFNNPSLSDFQGLPIGLENEKIKNVISMTPFVTEGIYPVGELEITENGEYDVTNYASAKVSVASSGGGEVGDGYKIRYIDVDGTVLKTEYVPSGGKLTPPSNSIYDSEYLEFNTWNCDIENYVVDKDTDVGATYKTKTGDTYFFIRLTESTGLTIPALQISGATSIDWGDGTVDNNLTHTYADYGDYVVKISGMTEITSYLFGSNNSLYNSSLLKCYLGDSVTNIGNYAFFNCYSLTNVVIPENVTNIGVYTFQGCYSLTSVVISDTVTSIGNYAFQSCSSLASVVIPEGIMSVGTSVFYNCYSLTSIVIPSTLTSIGERMFSCCYSLTNVAISKNVTSIGNEAFQSCYSLTNVIIPDTVISMGNNVFANCHSLTNVAIPNPVTSIGSSAFVNCYSLTNITIPKNVTGIGDGAFRACFSLANISIHDGMIAIKDSTFSNCSLLTSIVVPSTVTSIESYAFSGCYKIKDYVLKCSSVPTLVSKYAFSTINKIATIWVKDELVESYKTATNWSTYATHIKPISAMPQKLKEELGVL